MEYNNVNIDPNLVIKLKGSKKPLDLQSISGTVVNDKTPIFMKKYDKDGNGVIDQDEAGMFMKDLKEIAGKSDLTKKKLEKSELGKTEKDALDILKKFDKKQTQQSTDKVTVDDKNMKTKPVLDEKTGNLVSVTYDKDGKMLEKIEYNASTKEAIAKTTYKYNEKGLLATENRLESHGNQTKPIVTNYTYNEQNQKIRAVTTEGRGAAQLTSTTQFTYNADGNATKIQSTTKDSKGKAISATTSNLTYGKNGKIASSKMIQVSVNGKEKIQTVVDKQYNADGKMSAMHSVRTNNGVELSNLTTNYSYGENGKISKKVTVGKTGGEPYKRTDTFDNKGKRTSIEVELNDKGSRVVEKYTGNNLENRDKFIPTERIEYEADGKTIKTRTVNGFDDKGILISETVYDKDGKVTRTHDYSAINGEFDTSCQKGRGDCYLLAGLNALRESEQGRELLKQNIQIGTDAKGNKTYTLKLPGAADAIAKLKEAGVDPITIKDSYTFTEAQMEEYSLLAGKKYSAGDKDVLLLEAAFEQYRTAAKKDINKAAKLTNQPVRQWETNLYARGANATKHNNGDNLSSGHSSDAIALLTKLPSEEFRIPVSEENDAPCCQVSSDMSMHIVKGGNNLTQEQERKIDSMLDKLAEDSKDGKLDKYAATVSFNVTSQVVDGVDVKGGGHALTISKVVGDKVYLKNPWDPTKEFSMTRSEFKKATTGMGITPLPAGSSGGSSGTNGTGGTGGTNGSGGAGGTGGNNGTGGANGNTPPAAVSYDVKPGDNFWNIAKRELTKKLGHKPTNSQVNKYTKQIATANGFTIKANGNTDKILRAGATINIPDYQG